MKSQIAVITMKPPAREVKAPRREAKPPAREVKAPRREAKPPGRGVTPHVINVQSRLYKLVVLGGIKEPTLVRKLLHVTSV